MKTNKVATIIAVVCVALSLAIIIGYAASRDRPLGEKRKLASEYGGEFTLQSDKGPVSLSDLKGKVVVLYFGFMNCQDACPISMTKMSKAFSRLTDEELEHVQGIFVSIDPKRDSTEDLAVFAKNYHKNVIGLVSDRKTIDDLVVQYGGIADMSVLDGESVSYNVDHSSRFYMIDKQGKLLTTMSHSTTPAELVAKIQQMINT